MTNRPSLTAARGRATGLDRFWGSELARGRSARGGLGGQQDGQRTVALALGEGDLLRGEDAGGRAEREFVRARVDGDGAAVQLRGDHAAVHPDLHVDARVTLVVGDERHDRRYGRAEARALDDAALPQGAAGLLGALGEERAGLDEATR